MELVGEENLERLGRMLRAEIDVARRNRGLTAFNDMLECDGSDLVSVDILSVQGPGSRVHRRVDDHEVTRTPREEQVLPVIRVAGLDRKSTRLNSSHWE